MVGPGDWEQMVLVGRIARPHGLRGQVVVNPETDFPERRFAPGSVLWIDLDDGPTAMTVRDFRLQGGRPVIGLEGTSRIEDVESWGGRELRVPETTLAVLPEGVYYEHQLVGCAVETTDGHPVGTVSRVEGGGPRLVVTGPRGDILVPLAQEICVDIDVAARRIRVAPPDGLLELNVPAPRAPRTPRVRRGRR